MKFLKALVVVALAASIAGCMTAPMSTASMDKVMSLPKRSDGVLLAIAENLTGVVSAERICKGFPNIRDERCEKLDQYVGARVVTHTNTWSSDTIPVLVPKGVGVEPTDILKIRIDGNRPAYFLELAAKGMKNPDCYYDGMYGRGSGGAGGVVCPKHGWDYKRDVNMK